MNGFGFMTLYSLLINVNNLVVVQHQHRYTAMNHQHQNTIDTKLAKKGQTSPLVLLTNFLI